MIPAAAPTLHTN